MNYRPWLRGDKPHGKGDRILGGIVKGQAQQAVHEQIFQKTIPGDKQI
jgi:hypothetical protein